MKRYLLFIGERFGTKFGWEHFVASFDSLEEAIARCDSDTKPFHDAHVVDTKTMTIVYDN